MYGKPVFSDMDEFSENFRKGGIRLWKHFGKYVLQSCDSQQKGHICIGILFCYLHNLIV